MPRTKVSRVCYLHPIAVYLQNAKECKGCKLSNTEALKEFKLSPGMDMEEGKLGGLVRTLEI